MTETEMEPTLRAGDDITETSRVSANDVAQKIVLRQSLRRAGVEYNDI